MSEFAVEGSELKRMVKVARKQPVSFAMNPGKADADTLLAMHRRKPAALLGKAVKADGEGLKVAFGTCEVSGKVLTLSCDRAVPMLAKKLKRYMKLQKVNLNVIVLDADGNVLEEDIEDLPDDPSLYDDDDLPAADAVEDDPDQEAETELDPSALIARLNAIQPQLKALQGEIAEKLIAAFKAAAAQIKGADLPTAEVTIDRIEAVLAKLTSAQPAASEEAPPDPLGAKWQDVETRLSPLLAALVEAGHATAEKLQKAWDMAANAAQKSDFAAALQIAGKVEPHLTPAEAPPEPAAETTADDTANDDALENLRQALAKLVARAKPILQSDAELRDDIMMALGLVKSALDAGDATEGREQLFNATAFLNSLEQRKASLDELQAALPVSLALCKVDWEDASAAIVAQIASVRTAMADEIEADDIAAQTKKLQSLEAEVTRRGKALSDAMAEVLGADDTTRGQAIAQADTQAAEFKTYLEGNALLAHLVNHPLDQGDDPDHLGTLVAPLNDLAANLADARRDAA